MSFTLLTTKNFFKKPTSSPANIVYHPWYNYIADFLNRAFWTTGTSESTLTFLGKKSIGGTIAATGNSQATSAQITAEVNVVTASDGTKGLVLPAWEEGKTVYLSSSVITSALKVYPYPGEKANGGSANAVATVTPAASCYPACICIGKPASTLTAGVGDWYVIPINSVIS